MGGAELAAHGLCEWRFAEIRCADAEVSLTQIGSEEEREFTFQPPFSSVKPSHLVNRPWQAVGKEKSFHLKERRLTESSPAILFILSKKLALCVVAHDSIKRNRHQHSEDRCCEINPKVLEMPGNNGRS